MEPVQRIGLGVATGGLSELTNAFVPSGSESITEEKPTITQDQEDKAAADETEAEARRRRRGTLKRVYTTPGANFVNQSNIGRNSLTGA